MFYQLKIALRNLRNNGIYSAINVGGLAVSLAVCILIMLWINNERSFDKFHKRYKDIYMTVASFESNGASQQWGVASPALSLAAKAEIPEIENACRLTQMGTGFLKYGDNILNNVGYSAVDSTFFSIFDFQILKGDRRNMLPYENSVVLSKSAAVTLFGDRDPIGQTVTDAGRKAYYASGVIADMPQNSSNRYDVLFNFRTEEAKYPKLNEEWYRVNFKTYFLLRPDTDAQDIGRRLTSMHAANNKSLKLTYSLHSLEKENLYDLAGNPNTTMQACRLFAIAVAVLLLIACINYINLVTARASRRDKEISVRKILGANRSVLFSQFFNESLLLFFCSLLLSVGLIYAFFPAYNQIIGKELTFRLFSPETLTFYGIAFATVMLAGGIYPAVGMAMKKGSSKVGRYSGSNASVRRLLVVTQFAASVVLILGAVTMNRQMQFIKTKNPGYEKEHVFYMRTTPEMRSHTVDIKARLMQSANIEGVTFMYQPLTKMTRVGEAIGWPGKGEKDIWFVHMDTDADFIPVMGAKLVEGHNFTAMPSDSLCVILNQKAVAGMELENPVGKRIHIGKKSIPVIGVVEDFHFDNMHVPIKPLVITAMGNMQLYMYVKTRAGGIDGALKATEEVFNNYKNEAPFSYGFLDDEFGKVYQTDLRMGRLFSAFAVIAVIISSLGLFGLVTYTAETKTKEIGIRKVLGASVTEIVRMLSKEFLVLVGIAMLIAFPAAYWMLDKLLQNYAYRISVSWQLFAVAGLITVALTLITVGWQAVKAATADPVKSIKAE